jgi:CheY-like chemotaxis protein
MLYYHGILLKRLEYAVLTANTPEDALKIMDQTVPSLVLTAISFPSLNGVDFIKAIKSRDRTKVVPVIVLTAEEDASVRSACLSSGCLAYLIKPVDAGTLYRTIQTAMEATPRENIRISTSLKAVVGEEDAKDATERIEYATEISEKGAYVRTLAPKAKNALIPIRIYVKDHEIRVKAVVLYTHTIERGAFREPGMGLKFTEISENDRAYLRSFINAQLVSDIVIGS